MERSGFMQKRKGFLIVCSCMLLLSGCQKMTDPAVWEEAACMQTEQESARQTQACQEETQAQSEAKTIVIDISGAVVRPGVYELPEGSRICDAVTAAGGLLEDADLDLLNQAERLADAAKITVLTEEEAQTAAAGGVSGGLTDQQDGKIDLNTADAAQLCTLSGIGESRAKDIIAYREQYGPFEKIEDIMKVNGIKDATFNKIKEEIAVG